MALKLALLRKSELDAMTADDKGAGRFYCDFNVHKEHNDIPPPRPITSGSGSITENIGRFIKYHIKKIATTSEAYIEDTPDCLRVIDKINKGTKLHPKTMLVTWDAIALFTNIKHGQGLASLKYALDKRENPKVPTNSIVQLTMKHTSIINEALEDKYGCESESSIPFLDT